MEADAQRDGMKVSGRSRVMSMADDRGGAAGCGSVASCNASVRSTIVAAVATVVIAGSLLAACASTTTASLPPQPAAESIRDVRRNVAITRDALVGALRNADYVLIGEVHDNPAHHRIQRELLAELTGGKRIALAMEQFDRENQSSIDQALATKATTPDALADAGRFNRNGWNWAFYRPLVEIAIERRLPIVALNLSRDRTREIARRGLDAIGAQAVATMGLDGQWSDEQQAIQAREIEDGHCGQLAASAVPRMIDVQRARDATMADALVTRAEGGAIAFAGNGHVRTDVGVPVYLARREPRRRIVSVGLLEIDPPAEGASVHSTRPPFDYVWSTVAPARPDPCAGLVMPQRK